MPAVWAETVSISASRLDIRRPPRPRQAGPLVPDMAVYTEVSDEDLDAFVDAYDIGTVLSCKGIAEGVENTNYLMQTDQAQYILTLYEKRVASEDLPFFLNLMKYLADAGIPVRRRCTDGTETLYAHSVGVRRRSSRFSTACGRSASMPSIALR